MKEITDTVSTWAGRAWRSLRRWPAWVQVVGWLLFWWLLVPLFAWKEASNGKRQAVAASVTVLMVAAVVGLGRAPSSPRRVARTEQTAQSSAVVATAPSGSALDTSPSPTVPDVVGASVANARSALASLGLKVVIRRKNSGSDS